MLYLHICTLPHSKLSIWQKCKHINVHMEPSWNVFMNKLGSYGNHEEFMEGQRHYKCYVQPYDMRETLHLLCGVMIPT